MAILEEIVDVGSASGLTSSTSTLAIDSDSHVNSSALATLSIASAISDVEFDEFTLFPKLPAELRIKIWKLSFTPRTLQTFAYGKDDRDDKQHMERFWASFELPAAFYVCWESRKESLKVYELLFASSHILHGSPKTLGDKAIYFNANIDALAFAFRHGLVQDMEQLKLLGAYEGFARVKLFRFHAHGFLSTDIDSVPLASLIAKQVQELLVLGGLEKLDVVILHKGLIERRVNLLHDADWHDFMNDFLAQYNRPAWNCRRCAGRDSTSDIIPMPCPVLKENYEIFRAAILAAFKTQRASDPRFGGEAGVEINLVFEEWKTPEQLKQVYPWLG